MEDCIFCKIVAGKIPSSKVYENEEVIAFDDIHPMAPVHVIVIPRKHVPTLMDLAPGDVKTISELITGVQEVAKIKGIDEKGFRVVTNCNADGGQIIFHLHMHVLGGVRLKDELA